MTKSELIPLKIIWIALTASQLIYAALIYLQPSDLPPPTGSVSLWMMAIPCAVASLGIFLKKLNREAIIAAYSAHGNASGAVKKLLPLYVICWALNEAIVLYGFVEVYAFHQPVIRFHALLAAGLLLNLFMAPRAGKVLERLERS